MFFLGSSNSPWLPSTPSTPCVVLDSSINVERTSSMSAHLSMRTFKAMEVLAFCLGRLGQGGDRFNGENNNFLIISLDLIDVSSLPLVRGRCGDRCAVALYTVVECVSRCTLFCADERIINAVNGNRTLQKTYFRDSRRCSISILGLRGLYGNYMYVGVSYVYCI